MTDSRQLLSTVGTHGAEVSTENANHKILRIIAPSMGMPIQGTNDDRRSRSFLSRSREHKEIEESELLLTMELMVLIQLGRTYQKKNNRQSCTSWQPAKITEIILSRNMEDIVIIDSGMLRAHDWITLDHHYIIIEDCKGGFGTLQTPNANSSEEEDEARTYEEPKKISEALKDDSWVEAMQEELLIV
ncbi:hypothetical protein Tco_0252198 [Tanacetum coccineum]